MIDADAIDEWNQGGELARRSYHGFSINDPRHGTVPGYSQHIRSRLEPCQPCRTAQMRYVKKWKLNHLDGSRATIDATGTRRRIQALCRIGWPMRTIADRANVGIGTVSRIATKGNERVRTVVADRIAGVYDELSGSPGPSPHSVRHATRNRWAPPLSWDDIDSDTRPQGVASAA